MIEHLVLFKLKSDAGEQAAEAILDGLAALQGQIPGITALSCGRNQSDRSGGYSLALRVQFGGWADLEAYLPHPAHVELVEQVIRPVVESIIVADYEVS